MTGEAVAVGAGVSALGAGVGAYANNQALKKQDAAAAAGLMRQRALQGQANADVQQGVIKTATNNNANLAKNREAEQEQYAAALQRAQPVQSGSISGAPGGSKRYAADVMAARSGVADYGAKLGASTAAIDAPSLTNMQTQEALGDTATKLGLLGDTSNSVNNLTKMNVNSIQANPWVLAAGQALMGAGQGYTARNYGVKKNPDGLSYDPGPGYGNGVASSPSNG